MTTCRLITLGNFIRVATPVAAEVASGKSLVEAVQSVTSHGQVTKTQAQIIGERVLALTGWRLIIAKAIGII